MKGTGRRLYNSIVMYCVSLWYLKTLVHFTFLTVLPFIGNPFAHSMDPKVPIRLLCWNSVVTVLPDLEKSPNQFG